MNEKNKVRNPLSHNGIYRLMVVLTYLVSCAFIVKIFWAVTWAARALSAVCWWRFP